MQGRFAWKNLHKLQAWLSPPFIIISGHSPQWARFNTRSKFDCRSHELACSPMMWTRRRWLLRLDTKAQLNSIPNIAAYWDNHPAAISDTPFADFSGAGISRDG